MLKHFCIVVLCLFLSSCLTTDESQTDGLVIDVLGTNPPVEGIVLDKPVVEDVENIEQDFSRYFSPIDKDILLDIQKGSPSSIQNASYVLRDRNMSSEQKQVLLAICDAIMKYAWPSKSHNPTVFRELPENVYTSTLDSIKRGIYEDSFKTGDFFSLTLPSLVLFSAPNLTNYYPKAKVALEKSLNTHTDSVLVLYLLGVLAIRMEDNNLALEYLERARSLDVNNLDISYAYMEALINVGRNDDAYVLGTTLLITNPMDTMLLRLTIKASYELKNYEVTESLIAQAYRFDPNNTDLLLYRAQILYELEDFLEVSNILAIYSKIDPENEQYLLLSAKIQSGWNKNMVMAMNIIAKAITLYPENEEIVLFAANLASLTGQKITNKSAEDFAKELLEKNPHNVAASSILVGELVLQERWEEAYGLSGYVLSQEIQNLTDVVRHVEICLKLNMIAEARAHLDTVYTKDTQDEKILQLHIQLLLAQRKNTEAEMLIATLLPTSSGKMKSMLFYERSKLQVNESIQLSDLRSSLTANPRNSLALFDLYLYYFEREDYRKAQYYLKQVLALDSKNQDMLQRNEELKKRLQ